MGGFSRKCLSTTILISTAIRQSYADRREDTPLGHSPKQLFAFMAPTTREFSCRHMARRESRPKVSPDDLSPLWGYLFSFRNLAGWKPDWSATIRLGGRKGIRQAIKTSDGGAARRTVMSRTSYDLARRKKRHMKSGIVFRMMASRFAAKAWISDSDRAARAGRSLDTPGTRRRCTPCLIHFAEQPSDRCGRRGAQENSRRVARRRTWWRWRLRG
jgi:hypothetical protein